MRIAHMGDFHLKSSDSERVTLELLKDAAAQGADHLVVCGDIVDNADINKLQWFFGAAAAVGFDSSKTLSVVAGNHDIHGTWPMRVDWHGYQNFRICVEEHAGWGFKKLAPHIQLLGLHTVTDEPGIVNETSAQGLLGRTELRGVREWTARHRVVAMHHYPYSMGRRRLFDMNFHKPGPAMIRRRLRANGVTMVLCGHCHDLEVRRTGKVTISLSGKGCAEDGWYGYHLVELPRKGRVRVIERSFDNT